MKHDKYLEEISYQLLTMRRLVTRAERRLDEGRDLAPVVDDFEATVGKIKGLCGEPGRG